MQIKNIPDTSSQSSSLASSQGTNSLFASTNGNTYANTEDLLGSFNGLEFNSGDNNSNSKANKNNVLQPTAPSTGNNLHLAPSVPYNGQQNKESSDPLLGLVNLNNIASPPGKSPNKAHNKPMNMMGNGGGAGMLTPTTSHIDKAAVINAAFKGTTPIQPRMMMSMSNTSSSNNNNNMMMMMQQQQQRQQQQQTNNNNNNNPFDAFGL